MKKNNTLLCLFMLGISVAVAAEPEMQKTKEITIIIRMDDIYFRRNGGYPPPDSNAYLPLLDAIKSASPKVIFFDMHFIRPPLQSEKNFATAINREKKLIFPFILTSADYSENFEENRSYFGLQISAFQLTKPRQQRPMSGAIFPYPEIVLNSARTCAYIIRPDQDNIVRSFLPYYQYKDYIFSSASICIINATLGKRNQLLLFSPDFNELGLYEIKSGQIKLLKKVWKIYKDSVQRPIPLKFWPKSFFQAQDVQEKMTTLEKDQIIIVGPASDLIGSWYSTPFGMTSRLDILSDEINTLWSLIKNEVK